MAIAMKVLLPHMFHLSALNNSFIFTLFTNIIIQDFVLICADSVSLNQCRSLLCPTMVTFCNKSVLCFYIEPRGATALIMGHHGYSSI